ncbi:MAG TPA: pyridoxamine 5'-phosphate oxidase family protein [Candidatus Sulfomarinibacteraceae bacterium]|nr:pyridoxamine 5'-phosphate oxidase family protein [Candidatus Sulfomarinibacteraceae bacterium]
MRRRNAERWRAIEARLGRELTIWIATVREDGRPHLTPVWFVWFQNKIYFSTGSDSQKFANLYNNQNVALALPDTGSVVIIEGEAHAADRGTTESMAEFFFNKYEWDFRYDEVADWRLVEVTPHKILAWGDGYEEDEGIRVW